MAADLLLPLLFCGILCWGAVAGSGCVCRLPYRRCQGAHSRWGDPALPGCPGDGSHHAPGFRALELLCSVFAPAAEQLGLPGELLPMALLRPVSGSGALALFEDILTRFGPDSFIGRTASVLMGSTETTFYTIALYFGATKVRNTRHCLPAALLADLAGICLSAAAVGLFLGQ